MSFTTAVQKNEESKIDAESEKSRVPVTMQMFRDRLMDGTDSSSEAVPKQSDGCFFFSFDPKNHAEEEQK